MDPGKLRDYLAGNLSVPRWTHSLQVAEMAVRLAERHGEDTEKARFAGLAHDLAKEFGPAELLKKATEYRKINHEIEKANPDLLHGAVAAGILRERFGVEDESILRAVEYHTTGAPGMGRLEQILYLADFVEEGRTFPGVNELREICFLDLTEGMLAGINLTLVKVLGKRRLINPLTVETWNWLLENRAGRKAGFPHPPS